MDLLWVKRGDLMVSHVHSRIVIGVEAGRILVAEAVEDGVKRAWLENPSRLNMTSTLTFLRPDRASLAEAAASLAGRWTSTAERERLPYVAEGRREAMRGWADARREAREAEAARDTAERGVLVGPAGPVEPAVNVDAMRAQFFETGRFRAIKYAVRAAGSPMFLGRLEGGRFVGAGFTCTMFVVMAYQAAALAPVVDGRAAPMGRPSEEASWVSNKHRRPFPGRGGASGAPGESPEVAANRALFEAYEHKEAWAPAVTRVTSSDGAFVERASPRTGLVYDSPLTRWRGGAIDGFPWADRLTPGMLIDCKRCRPFEMAASLLRPGAGWKAVMSPERLAKLSDRARDGGR